MSQFSLKRYEDVTETLERAISLQVEIDAKSPKLGVLHAINARALRHLDRIEESVTAWRRALRSSEAAGQSASETAVLRAELGKTHWKLGDTVEARRHVEAALDIAGRYPDAPVARMKDELDRLLHKLVEASG